MLEGQVTIQKKDAGGISHPIIILKQGETYSSKSIAEGNPHLCSAISNCPGTVLILTIDFLKKHPEISCNLDDKMTSLEISLFTSISDQEIQQLLCQAQLNYYKKP